MVNLLSAANHAGGIASTWPCGKADADNGRKKQAGWGLSKTLFLKAGNTDKGLCET